MTDLAERLRRLPQAQREALLRKLAGSREEPQLAPRPPAAPAPAARQQAQLWFIDRIDRQDAANNLAYVWTFRGALDTAALHRALDAVVARHESLRTAFVAAAPVDLRVFDVLPWQLETSDLTGEPDPRAAFDTLARELSGSRFDLEEPPLFRALLARTGPDEHRLVWVVHHIVWDSLSVSLFLRDVARAYTDAASGTVPDLGSPEIAFGDYAHWQQQWLAARGDDLAAWWRRHLEGAAATELPTDKPRPRERTFGGDAVEGELLAAPARARLRAICAEEGVTGAMALTAAFATLLARWTRTSEVVFGSPFSVRPDERLESEIGFFVNMLPLRCAVPPGRSLREALRAARSTVVDAFDHRQLPFADIVTAVNPPRDLARSPLFQVELAYEVDSTTALDVDLPGLDVTLGKLHDGGSRFDVSVIVRERGDRLVFTTEYNPDLYERSTITGFMDALRTLLDAATAAPDTPLDAVPLVTGAQVQALARLGDGGPASPAPHPTVLAALGAQLESAPGAPAVRSTDGAWSYADLLRRAAGICEELIAAGVRPGDRVLLLAYQSGAAIASMLGVQLAGAAYVPLDPEVPAARLRTVAGQAAPAAAVVTTGQLHDRIADLGDPALPVVALAASLPEGDPQRHLAAGRARPHDVAYTIFTSGTTGLPKGVQVEHRGLAHFCREIARAYGIAPGDRVLAFAKLTFDVSVFEVFATLAAGACVCVAPHETRQHPAALTAMLRAERVTVAELPPALMPQLDPQALGDLRLVSVGGEAFPGTLVDTWATPGRAFWNGYGPTETTVAVTLKHCAGGWPGMPPIGRPLPGLRAYVVDEQLRMVPRGAVGELCIAGPQVARGYLGDAEGTRRAFVPEPAGPPRGREQPPGDPAPADRRAYRTGDLARWRPDGDLEFLGRADRQLKVNGVRVEPAEVEQALEGHPSVRQAVVCDVRAPGGQRLLAAFAVPASPLDEREVLRHARDLLPAAAVPSVLLAVEQIPLSPSGKVDLARLRTRYTAELESRAARPARTADLTPTERVVAGEVVPALLNCPVPDVDTSFFELGGNSLHAAQLMATLSERFDVPLTIAELFGHPTVRELARLIDGKERRSVQSQRDRESALARLSTPSGQPPQHTEEPARIPAVSTQQELAVIAERFPDDRSAGIHVAMRLRGTLSVEDLALAHTELARRHPALRTVLRPHGDGWEQRVGDAGFPLRLSVAEDIGDALVAATLDAHRATGFDLGTGPLAHAELVSARDEHLLVWSFHHAIADGYSLGVLHDDLATAYNGEPPGEEVTPFSAFATWQDAWVRSGDAERLAGTLAQLLPPGRREPAGRPECPDIGLVEFALAPGSGQALARRGGRIGTTLYMALLAAYRHALEATGLLAPGEPVWTPMAGRTEHAYRRTVGMFVNAVPIPDSGGPGSGPHSRLAGIQEACMTAFGCQTLPRPVLRALRPDLRSTALFALQNTPGGTATLRGCMPEPARPPGTPQVAPLLEFYSPVDELFAVALTFAFRGGELAAIFEYDRARVAESTVALLLEHLLDAISDLVDAEVEWSAPAHPSGGDEP